MLENYKLTNQSLTCESARENEAPRGTGEDCQDYPLCYISVAGLSLCVCTSL